MFEIQIYGVPLSHPGDCEFAEAAIRRAKLELKDKQYPAEARVVDKMTKHVVWSGSLTSDARIVENRPRV